MIAFLHEVPAWILCIGFILASIAYSIVGIEVIGRLEPPEMRHTYNDIVGFIIAVVGVVYAVLLAWAAIAVWEAHDRAEMAVEREASLVGDVARLSGGLSGDKGRMLLGLTLSYADTVINEEWPTMRAGERPDQGWPVIEQIQLEVLSHQPTTTSETLVQAQVLSVMTDLFDARRDRLYLSDYGVHPVIWTVIVLGTLVLVALGFFFGLEKRRHQVLSSILGVSVALVVFMIFELDWPFMGDISVDPAMFEMVAGLIRERMPAT